jgi:hypothetical protein
MKLDINEPKDKLHEDVLFLTEIIKKLQRDYQRMMNKKSINVTIEGSQTDIAKDYKNLIIENELLKELITDLYYRTVPDTEGEVEMDCETALDILYKEVSK